MKYTITAEAGKAPFLTVRLETNSFMHMSAYVKLLKKAFRDVKAIENETAEVVVNYYASEEFFTPEMTTRTALVTLADLIDRFGEGA